MNQEQEENPFLFPKPIFCRLRYLQDISLCFQNASHGLWFDSTGEIQLEPSMDAVMSLPPADSLPFSDAASDALKVVESNSQFSSCSLGPMLLIQWLFSKRHTRLSAYFLKGKKKISRLRYSNCLTNGIMGDHYKILSELSLHASKSKKLIYCRYTVERGN